MNDLAVSIPQEVAMNRDWENSRFLAVATPYHLLDLSQGATMLQLGELTLAFTAGVGYKLPVSRGRDND